MNFWTRNPGAPVRGEPSPLLRHLAGFEHIAIVGGLESRSRILFHQQDRNAEAAKGRDRVEDFAHDQRRETEARLVQQQQTRLCHQRAPERQHLPFAAGQRAGELPAALAQPRKAVEDFVKVALDLGIGAARIGAEDQIVFDGHVVEQFASFRHQAHATLDARLHIHGGESRAIEMHGAFGGQQTHRRLHQRRLARAVRPDDGDDAAGLDRHGHIPNRLDAAIGDADVLQREKRAHATPPR